jgi:hypothetical protein
MPTKPGRPSSDVSSAPESGTVRDDTSGNQPSQPDQRPAPASGGSRGDQRGQPKKDDPSVAGEER